ncbi:MAG: hypothetical protein KC482_04555 [Dehalococcoidia bacterium]|nr:hypothetical protein [Dehalococcoidia bacterium]MCA9825346.1 hypothetical protein [Dehalococcoidia bacterium]MCA9843936.1 hypothetical protein [Dehalococcoidia bacterium]MCA9852855.1 hypothetical protein [Dehalococcoidia bacterium]
MPDDYGVELEEVFEIIEASEVLIVRFHLFSRRLLVDYRARPGQPPVIRVVAPAESIEERFRSIKEMRPNFALPEKVMSFYWPRTIRVLEESGTWGRIAGRFVAVGGDDVSDEADIALRELQALERLEVAEAIRGGHQYQTMWERQRP